MLLVVLSNCSRQNAAPEPVSHEPQVRATVLTIRTITHPSNKTYLHWLVIAADRARLGNEVDQWRLFDFQKQTVTFVDDLQKTYRTEPIATVIEAYRRAANADLPDGFPQAHFVTTGQRREINGVTASQSIIRMGGYQRELWIASTSEVPAELFSMVVASEPLRSGLSGTMREVAEPLLKIRGFPLLDRAQLRYGSANMDIVREVVKIEQKDVPASWINVDSDYRQVVHRPSAPADSAAPLAPPSEPLHPAPVSTPTTSEPTSSAPTLPTATDTTGSAPVVSTLTTGTETSTTTGPSSTAAPLVTPPARVTTPEKATETQGPPKPTRPSSKKTPAKKGAVTKAPANKAPVKKTTTVTKKPAPTTKKPSSTTKKPTSTKKPAPKSTTPAKTST